MHVVHKPLLVRNNRQLKPRDAVVSTCTALAVYSRSCTTLYCSGIGDYGLHVYIVCKTFLHMYDIFATSKCLYYLLIPLRLSGALFKRASLMSLIL